MSAVLGFLITIAWWPGFLGAYSATLPREAAVAIGVPLLLKIDPRELSPRFLWLLLFGVAWAIGSAQGMEPRFWLIALAMAFVAGASLSSLDGIMAGMAIGLAVSAAICIAQLFGWQAIPAFNVPAGLFFSREVLAELAAPVAVWWWLEVWNGRVRLVFSNLEDRNDRWGDKHFSMWDAGVFREIRQILIAIGASLPLILCGERAAIFAAVAGLAYAWHMRPGNGTKRVIREFAAELTALALFGGLLLVFFGPVRWLTAVARVDIWQLTATAITPFGHGLGWFKAAYPDLDVAHSDALQILAEMGIGAVFFIAIPVICLTQRRGTYAERAVLVVLCVEAAVSFLFEMPANGFLAAIVTGYLAGRSRLLYRGAYCGYDDDRTYFFGADQPRGSLS